MLCAVRLASVYCHPSTAHSRRPHRWTLLAQMLAPVQPLDVSLSLSQHELESLQKGKLQRRKPPPLTPVADDAPAQSAASTGIPDVQVRHMQSSGSACQPQLVV